MPSFEVCTLLWVEITKGLQAFYQCVCWIVLCVQGVCAATLRFFSTKSPVTGSRIKLIPCTGSEGRLCRIFNEVSLFNEYFWQVQLELKELSPGCLSLVQRKDAYVERYANDHATSGQMQAITTLLQHLLTRHQCFTSVAISLSVFRDHHQLICDALVKNRSLEKLKFYAWRTTRPPLRTIATSLLHLDHLRELELQDMSPNRNFIDSLSEFLASTRSLKALTVTRQYFECEEDAFAFLEGLRRNQTIATLSFDTVRLRNNSLNQDIDISASPRCAMALSNYLRCCRTLRTLSIGGRFLEHFTEVHRQIVRALAKNKSLAKVTLVSFSLEDKDIQLISRLLNHNRTLTSFNLVRCDGDRVSGGAYSSLAVLPDNKTLVELALDLSKFNTNEYRPLFKALASNPCLKKVTVELFKQADVVELCRAVRTSDARERFYVGTHYLREDTVDALTECKELSSVAVPPQMFSSHEPVMTILRLLPSCSHVTSLVLTLWARQFEGPVGSHIAQCITDMTSVRTLDLRILYRGFGDAFANAQWELAQALTANKSIRRLRLHGPWFGETDIEMLAGTLKSSRTLCEMFFFRQRMSFVISLTQKLSSNISRNYTLLDMRLEKPWYMSRDWFIVADVLRRNCSLVTRAANFVMGTRLKYCAAAAELVHSNPGLVETVQKLASVDENEAASRIKNSLESFSEMDDFMRMAGVVKCGVTCHSRDDGQKQLVDIGRDCWLYLRQYIKVADILDEQ
ncbi:hypothetical protein HPB51_000330 [Rhipicephalus microplus]|uniref:Nlr family card domain protein n=1 Tax=Rhipicephalus microplus TaxID=6941 RepID=A0A9J6EPJ0_RHIMP|nr:hypothetical protein HPB51_000330 [Rhipicephalus microplus]